MIIYSNKFIYYHVPKTGGMWVSRSLPKIIKDFKGEAAQFSKPGKFIKHHRVPDGHPDKFTFCFFRNPLDWYKSLFRYKNTRQNWGASKEVEDYFYKIKVNDSDFNSFIKKIFKAHPEGFCSSLFREFESVDFIGRYENLIGDLQKALTLAKEDFDMKLLDTKPFNDSDKSVLAEYTKENEEMVRKADKYIFDKYYP